MSTAKWFDRQFDFNNTNNDYTIIYDRLQQAPLHLQQAMEGISKEVSLYKPGGKWSVKEHTGHLYILESLWQQRIHDIQNNQPILTVADLDNKATTEAGFNEWKIPALVNAFKDERNKTLSLLDNITEEDKLKTSLHPRLQQSMRITDHLYFVAEHDDHHIARIREIITH